MLLVKTLTEAALMMNDDLAISLHLFYSAYQKDFSWVFITLRCIHARKWHVQQNGGIVVNSSRGLENAV